MSNVYGYGPFFEKPPMDPLRGLAGDASAEFLYLDSCVEGVIPVAFYSVKNGI